MRRVLIATAAATALLAGASVAGAQTFQSDGYYAYGSDYYQGPLIERDVGLQIGPVGVYADAPSWGYERPSTYWRGDSPHSTYNSRAFRSQEVWPQSPPGGS